MPPECGDYGGLQRHSIPLLDVCALLSSLSRSQQQVYKSRRDLLQSIARGQPRLAAFLLNACLFPTTMPFLSCNICQQAKKGTQIPLRSRLPSSMLCEVGPCEINCPVCECFHRQL